MSALVLPLLVISSVAVEVTTTTDKTQVEGTLKSLTGDQLVVRTQDGETVSLATDQVSRVTISEDDSTAPQSRSTPKVVLTDGSALAIQRVVSDGQQLSLFDSQNRFAELSRRQIRSVQFRQLSQDDAATWKELTEADVSADQVAIKRGDRPLQAVEGVIGAIDDETVAFQFDGDWIDVNRQRVAGLVFYSAGRSPDLAPVCQMLTHSGSRIEVHGLAVDRQQDRWQVRTVNDSNLLIPLSDIAFLDFASGSTVYLSELEPERWSYTSRLQIDSIDNLQQQWYAPRQDTSLSGGRLAVEDGQQTRFFSRGLGLHSQTELVYRLAGEYRRFSAVAGLDPKLGAGNVDIVVLTDDQEQLRKRLTRGTAVPLDVNLIGVGRLTIRIEAADDSELRDHVNLCNARIVK